MRLDEQPDALAQSLAEPTRRAILEQLRYGHKTVSELVQAVQRKQPNVSNHLAKMRQLGLLRSQRVGRQIYYSLATPYTDLLLRLQEATHPLASEFSVLEDFNHSLNQPKEWQEGYLSYLLQGDEEKALYLINHLLAQHQALEFIYTEIFQWAMYRIGELYTQDQVDVAQEHLASTITERMMTRVAQFYAPVSHGGYRAVLGCVAGNWHTLGLRMLSDGLKEMGWTPLFLGANVPHKDFLQMVATTKPNLVLLSCVLEEHWAEAMTLAGALQALHESDSALSFLIAVGGIYINTHPPLITDTPFAFLAKDFHTFRHEVSLRFPQPAPLEGEGQ